MGIRRAGLWHFDGGFRMDGVPAGVPDGARDAVVTDLCERVLVLEAQMKRLNERAVQSMEHKPGHYVVGAPGVAWCLVPDEKD